MNTFMEWDEHGWLFDEDGGPVMCRDCGMQWRVPDEDEWRRWQRTPFKPSEARINMVCACRRKSSPMIQLEYTL